MSDLSLLTGKLRKALPKLEIKENEPMSAHCSFRIGGACAVFIQPRGLSELQSVCRLLRESGEKPLVIGNGTNLLVQDEYLPRVVLRFGEGLDALERIGENGIRAEAGITLYKLANYAASLSLAGLEFAQGIPGTLGGGMSMNAGAYGGELKDAAVAAEYLDSELELRRSEELALSYRHSRFSDTDDLIVAAELRLIPGSEEEIRGKMRTLMEKRRASQPLDMPSAGSTFKRPVGGYAAALIEEAGLKGYRIGGAMVSEKHAGFVINTGGATCADVRRLMEYIQKRVLETSGIALEAEVKLIQG